MHILVTLALIVSISGFLSYGIACFFSKQLVAEFQRYGVGKLRLLIGGLEVLGALGQLAGLYAPWLLSLSSACLAVLMLFAIGVRFKIRDPVAAILPAAALLLVNVFLAIVTYNA